PLTIALIERGGAEPRRGRVSGFVALRRLRGASRDPWRTRRPLRRAPAHSAFLTLRRAPVRIETVTSTVRRPHRAPSPPHAHHGQDPALPERRRAGLRALSGRRSLERTRPLESRGAVFVLRGGRDVRRGAPRPGACGGARAPEG